MFTGSSFTLTPPAHAVAAATAPAPQAPKHDFTFGDFLDIINPLQHLPVVGTLYRAVTGDKIKTPEKIVGDTLYGGPLGGLSALPIPLYQQKTGKNFGDTVLALVIGFGHDAAPKGDPAPVKAATASTPAPADTNVTALSASLDHNRRRRRDRAARALCLSAQLHQCRAVGRRHLLNSRAEQRAADAHMRRAEADRDLEIRAHAHAEQRQVVFASRSWRAARNAARASSSAGGMHIRPLSGRPSSRACAISAGASRGATPAFCGSSPVFTWTNRRSGDARPRVDLGSSGHRRAWAGRASGSRRTARPRRAPCWSAAARSDAARYPGYSAFSAGHLPCASCTRFSPKTR